jgi:hypothetical protein
MDTITYIIQSLLWSFLGFFAGVGLAAYFPESIQAFLPNAFTPAGHHRRKEKSYHVRR